MALTTDTGALVFASAPTLSTMKTTTSTPATQPASALTFPPAYFDMLAGHAEQALYDWLKAHAPAHVFAVFTGAALLRLMAAHPTDNSIASPAEIDETVIDVLKGMVAMGAAFGDGITTWRAALDEVQP